MTIQVAQNRATENPPADESKPSAKVPLRKELSRTEKDILLLQAVSDELPKVTSENPRVFLTAEQSDKVKVLFGYGASDRVSAVLVQHKYRPDKLAVVCVPADPGVTEAHATLERTGEVVTWNSPAAYRRGAMEKQRMNEEIQLLLVGGRETLLRWENASEKAKNGLKSKLLDALSVDVSTKERSDDIVVNFSRTGDKKNPTLTVESRTRGPIFEIELFIDETDPKGNRVTGVAVQHKRDPSVLAEDIDKKNRAKPTVPETKPRNRSEKNIAA